MFRNMNVRSLWINRRGSVAVEFAIISIFLLTFMIFLADLIMRQAMLGKLDRISYSIAGVLRERTQLYQSDETVVQGDVKEIYSLAARMMKDMDPSANTSAMSIRVEQMFFAPRKELLSNDKEINMGPTLFYGNYSGCEPAKPLSSQSKLAPRGSYGRWVPLYQVTVCVPLTSWYTRLSQGVGMSPEVVSSSIVMVR